MNGVQKGCISLIFKVMLKLYLLYYIPGVIALAVIFYCTGLMPLLSADSEGMLVVNKLFDGILASIPFDRFLELVFAGQENPFSSAVAFLQQSSTVGLSVTLDGYRSFFIRDLALTALSCLLCLFVIRANAALRRTFSGILDKLLLSVTHVLWIAAAFCAANGIVSYLESLFHKDSYTRAYLIVIVAAVVLHVVAAALLDGCAVWRVGIFVVTRQIFNLLRTVLCWFLWHFAAADFAGIGYFAKCGLLCVLLVFVMLLFFFLDGIEIDVMKRVTNLFDGIRVRFFRKKAG